jgi:Putative transposase of IS4/5 family (DUF4096)
VQRSKRPEQANTLRLSVVERVSTVGAFPVDELRVLNGIFWVLRSGAPWRDLPENDGPYTTCYNRFVRCRLDQIMEAPAGAGLIRSTRLVGAFLAPDGQLSKNLSSPFEKNISLAPTRLSKNLFK